MDRREYVETRRKRYLAQTLEDFEDKVEPLLNSSDHQDVARFKANVRRKFQALATDCIDLMAADPSIEINGAAIELRDRIRS